MTSAIVVIGSSYGDEGKGLFTDYFASSHPTAINVRFNGGAQAGHTVHTPDGQRHVFSHIGAGSFCNNATYLSEFFVCNPFLFVEELNRFPLVPKVFVHPNCLITTPYDMLINHWMEKERGKNIHGSCGIGFGETIERSQHIELTYHDLCTKSTSELVTILKTIRNEYVHTRLSNQALQTTSLFNILSNDNLITDFITSCEAFVQQTTEIGYEYLQGTLIFEGAQGLLLDPMYGEFPHVTRSSCGLKNVMSIVNQLDGVFDIDVNYVSRSYTTRHGAGPLPFEQSIIHEFGYNIIDNTNVINQFQGELRYAPLSVDTLKAVIKRDLLFGDNRVRHHLAYTCLDQIGPVALFVKSGKMHLTTKEHFHEILLTDSDYQSYGPTRLDVCSTN